MAADAIVRHPELACPQHQSYEGEDATKHRNIVKKFFHDEFVRANAKRKTELSTINDISVGARTCYTIL